jgi:hypothetical protein
VVNKVVCDELNRDWKEIWFRARLLGQQHRQSSTHQGPWLVNDAAAPVLSVAATAMVGSYAAGNHSSPSPPVPWLPAAKTSNVPCGENDDDGDDGDGGVSDGGSVVAHMH